MEYKFFDISPALSGSLAVFPGDTPFSHQVLMDMKKGDHISLSSVTLSLHSGAHADAPSHYSREGESIDERDLSFYFGDCLVLDLRNRRCKDFISVEDVVQSFRAVQLIQKDKIVPRILLRTDSYIDPNVWTSKFCYLKPDVVDYLADRGVVTIGVDTPSLDAADSKTLDSHGRIAFHNMAILEGLVLNCIQGGVYMLSAFPLKIQGAEAAPLRAVLIQKN